MPIVLVLILYFRGHSAWVESHSKVQILLPCLYRRRKKERKRQGESQVGDHICCCVIPKQRFKWQGSTCWYWLILLCISHLNLLIKILLAWFLLCILNLNLPITAPAVARHCARSWRNKTQSLSLRTYVLIGESDSQVFYARAIMMRSKGEASRGI